MDGYMDCYIAYLDILGFKSMIFDEGSFERIMKIYTTIQNSYMKNILDSQGEKNISIYENMKHIKYKIMSDSICLYIDKKYTNALDMLLVFCLTLQVELLTLEKPVLVRGAVVEGKIFHNNDILFGEGVVRAYLMEENNAKNPRIIITKKVLDNGNLTRKTWTYLERDDDRFYYLAYIRFFEFLDDIFGNELKNIKKMIEEKLDSTIDNSIREKYLFLESRFEREISNESINRIKGIIN